MHVESVVRQTAALVDLRTVVYSLNGLHRRREHPGSEIMKVVVVSGVTSGVGKTSLTVGLMAAARSVVL